MITFQCDRCDRELTVDDSLAGSKYECPSCGDVNIVPRPDAPARPPAAATPAPERDARSERPDRAAAEGYPPDQGPEQFVLRVRPAMARANPLLFVLLLLLLVGGGALWAYFAFIAGASEWAWLLWVGIVLGSLGLLGLMAWKTRTLSHALEITTKRSIQHTGLFSRRTSEVLHDNIRNIQIDQSFLDRVVRVGKVCISSAGQDDIEIQIRDIPDPVKLRKIIDLYRPL